MLPKTAIAAIYQCLERKHYPVGIYNGINGHQDNRTGYYASEHPYGVVALRYRREEHPTPDASRQALQTILDGELIKYLNPEWDWTDPPKFPELRAAPEDWIAWFENRPIRSAIQANQIATHLPPAALKLKAERNRIWYARHPTKRDRGTKSFGEAYTELDDAVVAFLEAIGE